MKFCLNSICNSTYLEKVDEIKLPYKEIDNILTYIEKYPEKDFIIDCFNIEDSFDWKKIERYNTLSKRRILLKVDNINLLRSAATLNVRAYFGYPIDTLWEIDSLKALQSEYIIPGEDLFFRMSDLKKAVKKNDSNTKIRVIPNVAFSDGLPHRTGLIGSWIRPEDLISIYGSYVDAVEFEDCDKDKEQALFRVYAEQKEWRTGLDGLITNFNYPGPCINRMLSSELSEARLNCGHRCLLSSCHICHRAMDLANPDLIKEYADAVNIELE